MSTRNFSDALGYCVRLLVRTATGMAAGTVRPAKQAAPTLAEGAEFATVDISDNESDFDTFSRSFVDDPTTGSTRVVENIDNMYRFTASVQFYRHSTPTNDAAGLSPFGMSAFDKATRLAALLCTSASMDLMETMGLGLEDTGKAKNLAGLIDGAVWDDRGQVDLTMVCFNREAVLINSFNEAGIVLELAQPGQPSPDIVTLRYTS